MVLCAWSSLTNPTWLFSTFQIFFAATWRSLDRKPKISILVGTVYQGSKFLRARGCHPDIEGRGLAVSRRWPHSAIQHWYGTTSDPLPPIKLRYFYNIYMISHTTFYVSQTLLPHSAIVLDCRPAQLAELPRSKFEPELFPHSVC